MSNEENIIYHYTTVDTLVGMTQDTSVENPYLTFWASYIRCMNDPTERIFGRKYLSEQLGEVETYLNVPSEIRFSEYLKQISLNAYSRQMDEAEIATPNILSVYSVSFSEMFDYLPMWAMYAKNGNGISLGFERGAINDLGQVMNIAYGKSVSEKDIPYLASVYQIAQEEAVNRLSKREKDKEKTKQDFKKAFLTFGLFDSILSCTYKDQSYEYEKEVRLLLDEQTDMHFRQNNGIIVPYVELKVPITALRKVIFGPCSNIETLEIPLKKLLNYRGIDIKKIDFIHSNVPYRG